MGNLSKFQLILLGIFAAFIIVGVVLFAAFRGSSSGKEKEPVVVWGTLSQPVFTDFFKSSSLANDDSVDVQYTEVRPENFDEQFVEALASGKGPDLFFLREDSIVRHRDKIFPIPYDNFSERQFKDTFIEEGELYLSPDGVLALPIIVDPLVMYWNRTLFSNASLANPPRFWEEFLKLATVFTKKDSAFNIKQSALSLGEYSNINNAKSIIATLVMQAGSPITLRDGAIVRSVFNDRFNFPVTPAEAAVNFYTEFSNPTKALYSWNRALPLSRDMFVSGDLAVYFGFASELATLRAKNPNLNFDVATIPQSKEAGKNITAGKMLALAITRNSAHKAAAFKVAGVLSAASENKILSDTLNLPPVRRDLLSLKPADAYKSVFNTSALWARGWLDPDRQVSGDIFQTMIETITSGKARTSEAIQRASTEINNLLSGKRI